jgi:hypothetical protein
MRPDTSAWANDDLRWAAGWTRGIWLDRPDRGEAEKYAEIARHFGMTATVEPAPVSAARPAGVPAS